MKKYLKRILALVLAVAMVVPNASLEALAETGSTPELEVKRNESIAFSDLIEKLAPTEDETTVTVTVPIVVDNQGNTVDKTVEVKTTEFPYYVGEMSSFDSEVTGIEFDNTTEETLWKSQGTAIGEWTSSEYSELKEKAEGLDESAASLDTEAAALESTASGLKATADAAEKAAIEYEDGIPALEKAAEDALAEYNRLLDSNDYWGAAKQKLIYEAAKALVDNAPSVLAELKDKATQARDAATSASATASDKRSEADNKKSEAANAWSDLAELVADATLSSSDITYGDILWTKASEGYEFKVNVYDILTVNVVDENETMSKLPTVSVAGAKSAGNNKYKLYDTETATLTVPTVAKYRFAVTGATGSGNSYTVGPTTEDVTVEVKYTEIGASSVTFANPTGATIVVNDGNKDIESGANVSAGTELTVTVTPDTGYTVEGIVVKDIDDKNVTLTTDNKFTTNTTTEDAYTISATVKFTGSMVNVGSLGENVKSVAMTVDEVAYTPGKVIAEGGKTVVVIPTEAAGFDAKTMTLVDIADSENPETITADEDGNFSFVAESGKKYIVSFSENGVEDITSSLEFADLDEGKERNATVTVKVEGDSSEYTLTSNGAIEGILPGAKVTVTITPDNNNCVSEFGFEGNGPEDIPEWSQPTWNSGAATFDFVAGTDKEYKMNVVTVEPILAAKESTNAEVNAYDILKMQEGDTTAQSDVEKALWNAFTSEAIDENTDIEYKYVAGTVKLPSAIASEPVPIYLDINSNVSAKALKEAIETELNIDLDSFDIVLGFMGTSVDKLLEDLLSGLHTFGTQDTETVKAIYAGTDDCMAAEATATVNIVDLRDASVTTAQDFSFTYGSDLPHAQLVELAQVAVTAEDGTSVEWNANDIEFSVDELAQKDAGTYTVKVSYKGNYDYKPSASEEITVTVNKANATVTMTEDNVVKYENRAKLLQDGFLYTINSDVVIEDTVAHIPFTMGLDTVEGKLAAKVDLSTMVRELDPVILEMVKGFLGDDLSMSLSEFLPVAKDLVQKLESAGIDTGLTEDTFKVIYGILEEAAGAVDVEVTITLDGTSYIPQNHGAYLVGVVTTDPNYNTAYNMTYIVITAEPVVVNFIDENGDINNERQFVFDGTQHAMTAQAFELDTKTGEAGDKIEGGTYTYYYVGIQSDGTPYASKEAPVHAGAYTVTAMYYGGDAQTPELFGMGTGAMTIWANDIAKVDVADKIVTYDEKNPTPVNVMDMITVNPDGINGDKAKIAVITAGLNVAGDFSEDGLSALEGVVNVDFPEKADEILKKIVPSAYADGITLATLNSKLAEIKTKLEEYGIDAAVIDEVMATINSIPDVTTLTFKEQSEVNPVNIGAYFVAAVVFDPDYMPDADAGILLITPEVTEEVLEWTYNDENGVITLPIISGSEPAVNLDAVATVNPDENNAKIKYLFVGIDAEGNAVKTDNAAELGNGVYTEIAYIPVEADATMMIAKPIMRTIVIAPQNVHVDFAPDENIDNARVFTYTGSAIEMPVEAKYLDGTDAKKECLKVTYTGVDSLGNVFENSEETPVNVGVYAVVATYTEYDPVTGELLYFGMNVGTMAIEPAASSVDVQYTEVEYDGNPHMATIVNEKGLDLVKIIVDEDGNVNIILPEEWGIDQTTVKVDDIDEAIDKILAELAKAESFSADEAAKISEVIAEIEKALSEMDDDATTELKAAVAELKEAVKLGAGAVYAADLEVKELLKEIGTPEAAKALEAIEELEDAVKDAINTEEISNAISEVKALLKDMKGDVSEEVHQILDEIEALTNEIGVSEVSKLIAEIETELNDIKEELGTSGIKSITINGEEPVNVGTYKVTAIVAGRNYKISSDTDTLVIYPKAITVTIDVVKTVENKGKEKLSPEGFEFVLEDAEGKVIDKQYSDKDGKAQFELTFDKDDIDEVFKYVVKETNTGKKYVTYSDKEYAINISIKLDGNELAETVDGELTCAFVNVYKYTKPSESGSGSGSGSSGSNKDDFGKELEGVYYPESASTATTGTSTGDSNNTVLWISVMGIAVLAVAVLFVRKKKSTK